MARSGVVARVGYPERVAVGRELEPLRVAEARLAGAAVGEPRFARPVGRDDPAAQVGDDDAVVAGVGDEEAAALLVGEHLARECEEGRGDRCLKVERDGGPVDQPPCRELLVDGLDHRLESLVDQLARSPADHAPSRVNKDDGGPRPHPPLPPDDVVGVVHDGVLPVVAGDRFGDGGVFLLLGVLARVNADHDEAVRELALEPFEVGDDVLAIDAALRPEVEQHDLAAQLLEAERLAHVEPRQPGWELRRRVLDRFLIRGRASSCRGLPGGV